MGSSPSTGYTMDIAVTNSASVPLLSSHSVVSDSTTPCTAAHQASCASPTPAVCSDSGPSSWWCHPAISSAVVSFSSPFNLSQHQGLFQWIGSSHKTAQSIGASASASALPMNIQGWFCLGLTGLISLQSKGLSRVFSSTTVGRHQFFST